MSSSVCASLDHRPFTQCPVSGHWLCQKYSQLLTLTSQSTRTRHPWFTHRLPLKCYSWQAVLVPWPFMSVPVVGVEEEEVLLLSDLVDQGQLVFSSPSCFLQVFLLQPSCDPTMIFIPGGFCSWSWLTEDNSPSVSPSTVIRTFFLRPGLHCASTLAVLGWLTSIHCPLVMKLFSLYSRPQGQTFETDWRQVIL